MNEAGRLRKFREAKVLYGIARADSEASADAALRLFEEAQAIIGEVKADLEKNAASTIAAEASSQRRLRLRLAMLTVMLWRYRGASWAGIARLRFKVLTRQVELFYWERFLPFLRLALEIIKKAFFILLGILKTIVILLLGLSIAALPVWFLWKVLSWLPIKDLLGM